MNAFLVPVFAVGRCYTCLCTAVQVHESAHLCALAMCPTNQCLARCSFASTHRVLIGLFLTDALSHVDTAPSSSTTMVDMDSVAVQYITTQCNNHATNSVPKLLPAGCDWYCASWEQRKFIICMLWMEMFSISFRMTHARMRVTNLQNNYICSDAWAFCRISCCCCCCCCCCCWAHESFPAVTYMCIPEYRAFQLEGLRYFTTFPISVNWMRSQGQLNFTRLLRDWKRADPMRYSSFYLKQAYLFVCRNLVRVWLICTYCFFRK